MVELTTLTTSTASSDQKLLKSKSSMKPSDWSRAPSTATTCAFLLMAKLARERHTQFKEATRTQDWLRGQSQSCSRLSRTWTCSKLTWAATWSRSTEENSVTSCCPRTKRKDPSSTSSSPREKGSSRSKMWPTKASITWTSATQSSKGDSAAERHERRAWTTKAAGPTWSLPSLSSLSTRSLARSNTESFRSSTWQAAKNKRKQRLIRKAWPKPTPSTKVCRH